MASNNNNRSFKEQPLLPIVEELTNDTGDSGGGGIQTKPQFDRWKSSFKSTFQGILNGSQEDYSACDAAKTAYNQVYKEVVKLSNNFNKLEDYVQKGDGGLSSVGAQKWLAELKTIAHIAGNGLATLLPGSGNQSATKKDYGYTTFHMGAILIDNGFSLYAYLDNCDQILMDYRDNQLLKAVPDKLVLQELETFHNRFQSFCDIMASLGLYDCMLRSREILEQYDEEEVEEEKAKCDSSSPEESSGSGEEVVVPEKRKRKTRTNNKNRIQKPGAPKSLPSNSLRGSSHHSRGSVRSSSPRGSVRGSVRGRRSVSPTKSGGRRSLSPINRNSVRSSTAGTSLQAAVAGLDGGSDHSPRSSIANNKGAGRRSLSPINRNSVRGSTTNAINQASSSGGLDAGGSNHGPRGSIALSSINRNSVRGSTNVDQASSGGLDGGSKHAPRGSIALASINRNTVRGSTNQASSSGGLDGGSDHHRSRGSMATKRGSRSLSPINRNSLRGSTSTINEASISGLDSGSDHHRLPRGSVKGGSRSLSPINRNSVRGSTTSSSKRASGIGLDTGSDHSTTSPRGSISAKGSRSLSPNSRTSTRGSASNSSLQAALGSSSDHSSRGSIHKNRPSVSPQQRLSASAAKAMQNLIPIDPEDNVAKKAAKNKTEEQKVAKEAEKQANQALKNSQEERLKKWNEQEKKRKVALATAASRGNTDDGTPASPSPPPVQRVPKLGALLARSGPEAEEYKKKKALAELAKWKSNAAQWDIESSTFDGHYEADLLKEKVVKGWTLEQAVAEFENNPNKYVAMHYSSPKRKQQPVIDEFIFVLREESVGYKPLGVRSDGKGKRVICQHKYQRLVPLDGDTLPASACDDFTENMTFGGVKLHSADNKPLLPGRGMGIGDDPSMDLMGMIPLPEHVRQGSVVHDCWLLSAIACLADFDFAVERLFRKTPNFMTLPKDQPNQYTVSLWDLKSWKEVDVVVDERLPVQPSGQLLGARPSRDGKFWVPYLEKAVAAHCGGYEKICGGNCTEAWPMLTGSRNQYMISKNPKTKKYLCGAKYNYLTQKWTEHSNSPHDSSQAYYRVDWPTVGGGEDMHQEMTEGELFKKISIWDQNNYLIGACSYGQSDASATDGIVDNHAYSVLDTRPDVCGTGIDLLLLRNPWGEGGELEGGQFATSGAGWEKYPNIKKELNPAMEDDGYCWVTTSEFFKYFKAVYVCAFDMTRLKDESYVNDLKSDFRTKSKAAKKNSISKNSQSGERVWYHGGRYDTPADDEDDPATIRKSLPEKKLSSLKQALGGDAEPTKSSTMRVKSEHTPITRSSMLPNRTRSLSPKRTPSDGLSATSSSRTRSLSPKRTPKRTQSDGVPTKTRSLSPRSTQTESTKTETVDDCDSPTTRVQQRKSPPEKKTSSLKKALSGGAPTKGPMRVKSEHTTGARMRSSSIRSSLPSNRARSMSPTTSKTPLTDSVHGSSHHKPAGRKSMRDDDDDDDSSLCSFADEDELGVPGNGNNNKKGGKSSNRKPCSGTISISLDENGGRKPRLVIAGRQQGGEDPGNSVKDNEILQHILKAMQNPDDYLLSYSMNWKP